MPTRIISDNITDGAVTSSKLNLTMVPIDDITGLFDGDRRTFTLRVDNQPLTIYSPFNLEIKLGGVFIFPARKVWDFFNLPEITEFDKGFTISGTDITFCFPPDPGLYFEGYFIDKDRNYSSVRNRQHPFSARAIMLSY